jgi:hypothetical protein
MKRGDCIAFKDPLSKREFLGLFVYEYTDNTTCVMDGESGKFFKVLGEQIRLAVGDEVDIIKEEWGVALSMPHDEPINMCRM